jgi:hypothetical protein
LKWSHPHQPKEIVKAKSFAELINNSNKDAADKSKGKTIYEKVSKGITKFKFRGKYLYTFKTKNTAEIKIIKTLQNARIVALGAKDKKAAKKAKK